MAKVGKQIGKGTVNGGDEVMIVGVSEDNPPKAGGGFVTGLLVGGALGALAALLYAPQGGDQTRGLIKQKTDEYTGLAKDKANDLSETAKAKAADIADKAGDTADSAKAKAAELADTVKAKATDVTDTVKAKSNEVATSVKGKATDRSASVKENAQSFVDQGRALVEDQQSRISEAVAAGKQAAHDKEEELTASLEADGDMDRDTGGMSRDNASKTSASI